MESESPYVLAQHWLDLDKDPTTRAEIQSLIDSQDDAALISRLSTRIKFGTAGLRAGMEAGFSRMNCLTVIQASQGLAAYLLQNVPRVHEMGVVIGHDHRHNSESFANLTAAAFLAKCIPVSWLGMVHTPLVPFAIKTLHSAAGVMITASHNPAKDNGYKVYWANACQIIPPHDAGIARAIDQNLDPVSWDMQARVSHSELVQNVHLRISSEYFSAIQSMLGADHRLADTPVICTPMHGVGYVPLMDAIRHITAPDCPPEDFCHVVPEQKDPDPDFPTVKFPNPEEKGALDLATQHADRLAARLVIALDPDADRFAVAQKLDTGAWHQFSGNEVGMLFAAFVLEQRQYSGLASRKTLAMLGSTVSTGMLRTMAEHEGFRYVETLTGFKWLGNMAQNLESEDGLTVPFAFEEALGYMFTAVGHDKDGVCAAAVFLVAVDSWRREQGLNPWQKMQTLYQRYAHFADANTYLVSPSAEVTKSVFESIRRKYPDLQSTIRLGTRNITSWRDLTVGFDTSTPDLRPTLPVDPNSQMITCDIEGRTRFTVRGSGTEPKIKLYIESRCATEKQAKAEALAVQHDLIDSWFEPAKWNLKVA